MTSFELFEILNLIYFIYFNIVAKRKLSTSDNHSLIVFFTTEK